MAPADDKNALLQQLRIDRTTPERRGIPRAWWLGGVALLAVLAAMLAGLWLLRSGPSVEVEVASAEAPAQGGAGTAVLQATGYVTARREATVSAQITGTLTQVLIEEGEHVAGRARCWRGSMTPLSGAALAQAQAQLAGRAGRAEPVSRRRSSRRKRDLVRNEDLRAADAWSRSRTLETAHARRSRPSRRRSTTQEQQVEAGAGAGRGARVQLELHRGASAVYGCHHCQGRPGRRDCLADLGRRRLHAHRGRHHRRHGFPRDRGGRQRGLHPPRAARTDGAGGARRLSRTGRSPRMSSPSSRPPIAARRPSRCASASIRRIRASCRTWACAFHSSRRRRRSARRVGAGAEGRVGTGERGGRARGQERRVRRSRANGRRAHACTPGPRPRGPAPGGGAGARHAQVVRRRRPTCRTGRASSSITSVSEN